MFPVSAFRSSFGATCCIALTTFCLVSEPVHALRRRQNPVACQIQDIAGQWESLDETTLFVLSHEPDECMIQVTDEGTTTYYPITWQVDEGCLELHYSAEPYQETIDPYQELFWRPKKPRSPDALPIHLSADGKLLRLGKELMLKRYRR